MSEHAPSAPRVVAVAADAQHRFSKPVRARIELVVGHGVVGDAHAGPTVRHRSQARREPQRPNLRQVHLVAAEVLEELGERGYDLRPGDVGENVLTAGLDLLTLPFGTVLHLGSTASVEVTGLRNPCRQLDEFRTGLMTAVLDRDERGGLIRRAGVMSVVRSGGEVSPGDPIRIELPRGPHQPLAPV